MAELSLKLYILYYSCRNAENHSTTKIITFSVHALALRINKNLSHLVLAYSFRTSAYSRSPRWNCKVAVYCMVTNIKNLFMATYLQTQGSYV